MAYTYRIDPAERLAHLTFTETVTGPELGEPLFSVYQDAGWQAGYDTIWDFRAITQLLLDEGDLEELVSMDLDLDEIAGNGSDAIVMVREQDHFIGKLFLHLAKSTPRPNYLCCTLEEARTWLGLAEVPQVRRAAA